MQRDLIITADGSHSVYLPSLDVAYHSRHGAITESRHVFIELGLKTLLPKFQSISIFEMGFGTGLNALLTLLESGTTGAKIYYHSIDAYPLEESFIPELNYCAVLNKPDFRSSFDLMHNCPWETNIEISSTFLLHKSRSDLNKFATQSRFDIIYFDAFAPAAQPELWKEEVFRKLFDWLIPGGLLVTYCSKGSVQRAMRSAGFIVEKLPGPPHKREIIRAVKT